MKQSFRFILSTVALVLGVSLNAHAALIPGVTQTYPDVSMGNATYIVFDHNAAGASIGTLFIVTQLNVLNEGPGAGNSTQSQSYSALTQVLSVNVTSTGAFAGGTVSILSGTGAAKFAWSGTVTNAGFNTVGTSTSPLLNGTWTVTSDTYSGLNQANLGQFVNGYLTGASGGFNVNTQGTGFTLSNASLLSDWIVGSAASAPTLPSGIAAGLTTPYYYTANVTVDVFATPVPLPTSAWMFLGGLILLVPVLRRRLPNLQAAGI